jgi:hypothetical protein
MPAGTFSNQFGDLLQVASSDCSSVGHGVNKFLLFTGQSWKFLSCSSDPVVEGSTLLLSHMTAGYNTVWSVNFLTATPDFSVATYVLLVCVAVVLFVLGFHSGNKAA